MAMNYAGRRTARSSVHWVSHAQQMKLFHREQARLHGENPAYTSIGFSQPAPVPLGNATDSSFSKWSGEKHVEYFDARVHRIVSGPADAIDYERLWRKGLLKHQRLGLPCPAHLPILQ